MNRRSFLASLAATASGLLIPEPRKIYSFAKELRVPGVEPLIWSGPSSDGVYRGIAYDNGISVATRHMFDADVSVRREGTGMYAVTFHRRDARPVSLWTLSFRRPKPGQFVTKLVCA